MLGKIKIVIFGLLQRIYHLPVLHRFAAPMWRRIYRFIYPKSVPAQENGKQIFYIPPKPENPDYFIITSAGQNGSLWRGSSLHLHPEILCSCGYDAPPISLHYAHNDAEWEKLCDSYQNESDFSYGVMDPFLAKKRGLPPIPRKPQLYSYVLEELESLPKIKAAKIIGNVHAVHAHQLYPLSHHAQTAMGGRFEKTRFLDLVRHPVTRLDSVINLVKERMIAVPNYLDSFKGEIDNLDERMHDLERNNGADFSDPVQKAYFFVEYVQKTTQGWAYDAYVMPEYPRIIFERARTDRDYFSWIVDYISGGKVKADSSYLNSVFDDKNKNAGRISGRKERKELACDVYNNWPSWVRKDFAQASRTLELQKKYDRYGYDLSFVEQT